LSKAHPNTIRKAIKEAEEIGKLEKGTMPGKHGKKILRLKQQNQEGIREMLGILTIDELSESFKIPKKTIYKWAREKKIPL